MSEQHARLAPSSASVWAECPGSVVMQEQIPELPRDVDTGAEGTAAHWMAAEVLGEPNSKAAQDYLGTEAPNGVIITYEMIEAAQVYIQDVLNAAKGATGDLHVEYKVQARSIHPTDNWGTLDCALTCTKESLLIIWDLKYGWGIVSVYENLQLVNYAIGALEAINTLGNPMPEHVELRVVQPRPYHPQGKIRKWRLPVADLKPYAAKLACAATEATGASPRTVAGDHCRYCSARYACDALNAAAYRAVEIAGTAVPMNLNGPQIGSQLSHLKQAEALLKARITGLEEQAVAAIRDGKPVNGWSLKPGQSRREWTKPVDEVVALGTLMGVDISKPGVMTPTQAIAAFKKAGIKSDIINNYSQRKGSGFKLVADNKNRAEEVFK